LTPPRQRGLEVGGKSATWASECGGKRREGNWCRLRITDLISTVPSQLGEHRYRYTGRCHPHEHTDLPENSWRVSRLSNTILNRSIWQKSSISIKRTHVHLTTLCCKSWRQLDGPNTRSSSSPWARRIFFPIWTFCCFSGRWVTK
jgi:hypothetical protein